MGWWPRASDCSRRTGAARDRLRNPGWPQEHAAAQHAKNLADPDMLVLVVCAENLIHAGQVPN
jgi:hypothetical protein